MWDVRLRYKGLKKSTIKKFLHYYPTDNLLLHNKIKTDYIYFVIDAGALLCKQFYDIFVKHFRV